MKPLDFMNRAIEQGRRGLGFVSPNPAVGCVIVKDGQIIGEGYHQKYGEPHAEVNAVSSVSNKSFLEGSEVYVTLEPCSHHGKTPPCADLLIESKVAKVFVGCLDPNPLVSGKGIEKLKAHGIEVELLEESTDSCEELAETFLVNHRKGRSFVALKVATSLDGVIALDSGESRWITGDVSRRHSHYLRGIFDATLVGANTFLRDNPRLNIRHERFEKLNKAIIMDPSGRTLSKLEGSRLLESLPKENIYLATYMQDISSTGCQHLQLIKSANGRIDLDHFLKLTLEKGIRSIFVEGGAQTISSFLNSKISDRLYQFVAPSLLGTKSSLSWTKGVYIEEMKDRIEIKKMQSQVYGKDLLITGVFDF